MCDHEFFIFINDDEPCCCGGPGEYEYKICKKCRHEECGPANDCDCSGGSAYTEQTWSGNAYDEFVRMCPWLEELAGLDDAWWEHAPTTGG